MEVDHSMCGSQTPRKKRFVLRHFPFRVLTFHLFDKAVFLFQPLFKEGYETRVSPTLKSIIASVADNKIDLLKGVGKALAYFTKHQVMGLYMDSIYQYHDPSGERWF